MPHALLQHQHELPTTAGLLAYGPLAGGTLSGKYLDGGKPVGSRHSQYPNFQPRYHAPRTMAAAQKYAELAKSKGISATTLALAWCARH